MNNLSNILSICRYLHHQHFFYLDQKLQNWNVNPKYLIKAKLHLMNINIYNINSLSLSSQLLIIRGDVKMLMSDENLNSLSFLLDQLPPPQN